MSTSRARRALRAPRALRALCVLLGLGAVALVALVLPAGPAAAQDGTIAHVEPTDEGISVVVSVPPDVRVDLAGVAVSVDGRATSSEAVPAGDGAEVRRTTVLAIDSSASMSGARLAAAQDAARGFLAAVPDDVYVGIVTFAGDVTTALEPTQDRAEALAVVDGLTLSRRTRLYEGVLTSLELAGVEGQRSLLVLSDGADTTGTDLAGVTEAVAGSGVMVDVVALEQRGAASDRLEQLAAAGGGRVVRADSQALAGAFSAEADVLARQVLVTAALPDGVDGDRATVTVTLPSDAGDVTAASYVPVRESTVATDQTGLVAPRVSEAVGGRELGSWAMLGGVGAVAVGLLGLLALLVPRPEPAPSADERLARYTRESAGAGGGPGIGQSDTGGDRVDQTWQQAKDAVATALHRNAGLEARIARRLEGAGSRLKPAEWLMVVAAVVVVSALVGLVVGGGSLVVGLLFVVGGLVTPWLHLALRRRRRRRKFDTALPDTLQLMSGSLSAGLSLAQSIDTIVREGTELVSAEFKRVLVETRLGVPLEDALDGVATRFQSKDFEWVVMAIRIQRQVGGNLAELLDTVAATMREREYVRRQVNALAAEGKLSAIVIGALPVVFMLYLLVAKRDYVMIMFTDPRGILMLVFAGAWLGVGMFWMSKLVKVEV